MTPWRCEECGARYQDANDSCQARFDQLLALDHSRQEPWGSRHGLAFAAVALQHPRRFPPASVARSRELITRVVLAREPLAAVVAEFRAQPQAVSATPPPPLAPPFAVTIADLGDFPAETYQEDLLRWARAAVGAPSQRAGTTTLAADGHDGAKGLTAAGERIRRRESRRRD
jgi:hypothetical protein